MAKEMSIKTSLANKSRNNRLFIDNLCRQIAVEITLPFDKRDTTWYDVLAPSYCSRIHGKPEFVTAAKTGCVFRPATAVLNQTEINAISEFIVTTPTCANYREAWNVMHALFNDCQLSALNIMIETTRRFK